MNIKLKIALAATVVSMSAQSMAQITFYEHDGWRGRAFTTAADVRNFSSMGFNDRASSVVVERGQWEVCDDNRFGGNCMVLRRGSYESLSGMGMNDRISSVRRLHGRDRYENEAPEPLPEPTYEYRRRPNEGVYQATVTSVRAVFGEAEQRCWSERQQVRQPSRNNNVGGAVVGAILGGVLGHQVGDGRGRDLATAGGAVAGAAIGANTGNNGGSYSQDIRRCESVPDQTPDSWDVTYVYRGTEHRIQMSTAPGRTIAVNRYGEPRQ